MTWEAGCLILGVLLLVAAAGCAFLYAERRGLRAEALRLGDELQRCEGARQKLAQENTDHLAKLERLDAERAAAEKLIEHERAAAEQRMAEAKAQFAELQARAKETFQSLAGDTLKAAAEQFIQRAQETFDGRSKADEAVWSQRSQAIESIVKPIKETLERHEKAVGEIERHREGAYHALKQQITSMEQTQQRLQSETASLVTALRRPDVRGQWGEVTLRRVVELAGMVPHCDFSEQVVVKGGDGALKPDMVIRLPAGRTIAVDAKTPLIAFIDALGCNDDESRAECLRRHLEHIQQKVRDLAAKRYQDQFDRSPDFTILFIPLESSLHPALELEPQLIERAMNLGVVIATPTTLVSLLKAVAIGWREEQLAENAERISALGKELHKRMATAVEHLSRLGRSLGSTVESYNRLVGSVESSVLPQTRRFKDLAADSSKELPAEGEVPLVEVAPREVRVEIAS